MTQLIQFSFRQKLRSCAAFIDSTEYPCMVFIVFHDQEIISEFGDEITLKTDCERVLPKKDDYPQLITLKRSILAALQSLPEFIVAKAKMNLLMNLN